MEVKATVSNRDNHRREWHIQDQDRIDHEKLHTTILYHKRIKIRAISFAFASIRLTLLHRKDSDSIKPTHLQLLSYHKSIAFIVSTMVSIKK